MGLTQRSHTDLSPGDGETGLLNSCLLQKEVLERNADLSCLLPENGSVFLSWILRARRDD